MPFRIWSLRHFLNCFYLEYVVVHIVVRLSEIEINPTYCTRVASPSCFGVTNLLNMTLYYKLTVREL